MAMSEPSVELDVLVIGGGINGAGVAADAAGRGLKVSLCEKGDLACATSSASSKLIHGGLRYLEHYEFRLVKEALAEREVLLEKAPHIIWPLRFRLPHQKHLRPQWMIRAGLFLYDRLAKRNVLPASRQVKISEHSPLKSSLSTCFEYADCWVDDARLVVLNAMAARDQGATIMTHTECLSAEPDGKHWRVTLRDADGLKRTVISRAIVNASGPWATSFLGRVSSARHQGKMRMVKGSHIIVPKIHEGNEAYILQNADGRIVFVIPYENDYSLIGTTDENYTGDPGLARISEQETDYLLEITATYFKHPPKRADIVHSYSGVRPLLEDENASAQALTRDYKVTIEGGDDKPVLVNLFGGKITTFRTLAEHAVNKLCTHFPRAKKPWTKHKPLPGGSFQSQEELGRALSKLYPWLDNCVIQRYVRQYGTLCQRFLAGKESVQDLGKDFGSGLYEVEVRYLIAEEWARHAEDILWRRTKQGLRLSSEQVNALSEFVSQLVQTNSTECTKSSRKVNANS